MSADTLKTEIPDEVIESLARCILPSIRAYFESVEGQKEYAEWVEKRKTDQAAVAAIVISD